MQALADTAGYAVFVAAVLWLQHTSDTIWTALAFAVLFIIAWFLFAYDFGDEED